MGPGLGRFELSKGIPKWQSAMALGFETLNLLSVVNQTYENWPRGIRLKSRLRDTWSQPCGSSLHFEAVLEAAFSKTHLEIPNGRVLKESLLIGHCPTHFIQKPLQTLQAVLGKWETFSTNPAAAGARGAGARLVAAHDGEGDVHAGAALLVDRAAVEALAGANTHRHWNSKPCNILRTSISTLNKNIRNILKALLSVLVQRWNKHPQYFAIGTTCRPGSSSVCVCVCVCIYIYIYIYMRVCSPCMSIHIYIYIC